MMQTVSGEVWRDVPNSAGYQASDKGRVRSCWMPGAARRMSGKWHILKAKTGPNGHMLVSIRKKWRFVHRLVLESFVGPCPEKHECCHIDGNPANNSLANLYWGTRHQNIADRDRHGQLYRGEKHKSAILKDADVLAIRQRVANGESPTRIARDYRVTESAIRAAASGKNFKHLPGAVNRPRAVRAVVDEGGQVPAQQ